MSTFYFSLIVIIVVAVQFILVNKTESYGRLIPVLLLGGIFGLTITLFLVYDSRRIIVIVMLVISVVLEIITFLINKLKKKWKQEVQFAHSCFIYLTYSTNSFTVFSIAW